MRTPERSSTAVSVQYDRTGANSPAEEREQGTSVHSPGWGSVRSRSPSAMSSISEHMARQRSRRRSVGGSSVVGSTIAGSILAGSTSSRPGSTVGTPPRSHPRATSRPTSRATSRTRTVEPEGSDMSQREIPGSRDWYLEMKGPPHTATYARGPFESQDLVERLGLNNGEVALSLSP